MQAPKSNGTALRLACALLVGIALGLGGWWSLMVSHATEDGERLAAEYQRGYEKGYADHVWVQDKPAEKSGIMPLFLQKDSQWSDVVYSDGTIGTYGCGLTAAAMAVNYLTTDHITPSDLLSKVGESCLSDRVNDMSKFTSWLTEHYAGLGRLDTFWGIDDALKYVDEGWLVFGGMGGSLGDRTYGGHIILIWKSNGDGTYLIRDSDDGSNSIKAWTRDELEEVEWGSFNAIKNQDKE